MSNVAPGVDRAPLIVAIVADLGCHLLYLSIVVPLFHEFQSNIDILILSGSIINYFLLVTLAS